MTIITGGETRKTSLICVWARGTSLGLHRRQQGAAHRRPSISIGIYFDCIISLRAHFDMGPIFTHHHVLYASLKYGHCHGIHSASRSSHVKL